MNDEPLLDSILISSFVHQIISPLNGLLGTLDNIIDGTTSADRRPQRLRAVRAQLAHSIELIRNLAFLSQLSSDQGALALREKATNVVIPALVIEAAMYYQEAGEGLGIGINLADRKTQYVVKGHADLLRQVFINVFDNGVKYSDQDTKITVTPHAQSHTGHLLVDIESTGVGFPFEERERIFERGYRGSAAQEIKASGTGLGLYICRRILEVAHNATIEAEYSPKTRKTLFRIRFREFEIGEPYGEGRDESFSTDC